MRSMAMRLQYSDLFIGRNAGGRFAISANTGLITVAGAIDFEQKRRA